MYQNSSSLSRFGTLFLVRVLKQNCKRNLAVFRRGAGSTKNDRFWYSLASSSVSEKSSSRKLRGREAALAPKGTEIICNLTLPAGLISMDTTGLYEYQRAVYGRGSEMRVNR